MIYCMPFLPPQKPVPAERVVTFVVDGEPLPKQRPRFNTYTGEAYTPKKTKVWENTIGKRAKAAMMGQDPLTGNLSLTLEFRRKNNVRADIDNLVKAIDGLNGIVWNDDKQVTELRAVVHYASKEPGVTVTVRAA